MITKISYNNFNDFMNEKALKLEDKIMLIDPEKGSQSSYKEANKVINKTANFLLSLKIKKNDKVAFISLNCFEFIYVFFACQKIGAVFHPINPALSEEELFYVLDNSDSVCVFADEENLRKVNLLKKRLNKAKNVFNCDYLDRITSFDDTFIDLGIRLDANSVLMYSSGTTGNPKGIILTQENLLYGCYSMMRSLHLNDRTIGFANLPFFFSGGLFPSFIANVCANATIIVPKKFSKTSFWRTIDKYKVTWTFLVPTMLSFLLNPPEDIKKYDISSLKFICSGAAAVPIEVAKEFEKVFGKHIVEIYGLTENTAWTSLNPIEKEKVKLGSVGKPLDIAEMGIFDAEGNQAKDGVEGEIVIKGFHVFKEYYKNPDATEKTLKNGWLHSGDLGYRDEDGYFYVSGRIKEIIKKGGVLLSPAAIDQVFYRHDAVQDAATIGVPDKVYGEEIVTFVLLKERKKVTEKQLKEFCMGKLERFKCPKEIIFTDSIPKGPSGKLLRRELLKRYLEK